MAALTQAQLSSLQTYVNSGNRIGYWTNLAAYQAAQGQDNRYALLALGVAQDNTASGMIANDYMRAVGQQKNITVSIQAELDIGIGLIQKDLSMRKGNIGNDLVLDDIRIYHRDVFETKNLPAEAWTAYNVLVALGDGAWDTMLNAQSWGWNGNVDDAVIGTGIMAQMLYAYQTGTGAVHDAAASWISTMFSGGVWNNVISSPQPVIGSLDPSGIVTGTDAGDILVGTANNNTMFGDKGNDVLHGLGGSNWLHGGTGNDTADYTQATGAISVDARNYTTLAVPDVSIWKIQNGYGGTDALTSIEKIIGSKNNDIFIGDINSLSFDGGAGRDLVDYSNYTDGLIINLTSGSAQNILGNFDILANFEDVKGTKLNDTIIGNDASNLIYGGDGADNLKGGIGNDQLFGGTGNDTIYGGDGNDWIEAGSGNDRVYGGAGNDVIVWDVTNTGTLVVMEWNAGDVIQIVGANASDLKGEYIGGDAVFKRTDGTGGALQVKGLEAFKDTGNGSLPYFANPAAAGSNPPPGQTPTGPVPAPPPAPGQNPAPAGPLTPIKDPIELPPEPPKPDPTHGWDDPNNRDGVPVTLPDDVKGIPVTSPLVIDMDGDGIELINLANDAVYWDIDNDGMREATAWVKADDAFLAIDRNGNGWIDDHSELFGTKIVDGFTILSKLDTLVDDRIDSNDAAFTSLRVWRDLNQDGISQSNELQTLTQAGIKSISLNDTYVTQEIEGNAITNTSTVTMTNGTTKTIVDAWFQNDGFNSLNNEDYVINPLVLSLPNIRGYGDLKDLYAAMSLDAGLLAKVTALKQMTAADVLNPAKNFDDAFSQMLLKWSGQTQQEYISHSVLGDARKAYFLEHLVGNPDLFPYPFNFGGATGKYLNPTWEKVLTFFEAQFLGQTVFKSLFAGNVYYHDNTGTFNGITGLSSTGLTSFKNLINATSDKVYGWTTLVRVVDGAIGIDHLSAADKTLLDNTIKASASGWTLDKFYALISTYHTYEDITGVNNSFTGTNVADFFWGWYGNDTMNGGRGDDYMLGGHGNDTYNGGAGDDFYYEANDEAPYYYGGDDNYIYTSGNDAIANEVNGNDKITLGTAVTLANISIQRVNADNYDSPYIWGRANLVVNVANAGSITVREQYGDYDTFNGVETLKYGTSGTINLLTLDTPQTGTTAANTLTGLDRAYYLNDRLIGLAGNDTLNGKLGVNYLDGGEGDDTYNYGGGQDYIVDASGNDKIVFSNTYDPTKLTFKVLSNSYDGGLSIYYDGKLAVHIANQFSSGIEQLVITGKTTIDLMTYRFEQFGTAGDDSITGLQYNASPDNKIYGYAGNDLLYGGDGNDILDGGAGDDTLMGGSGDDLYIYNGGMDIVNEGAYINSGTDVLQFGEGITAANIQFLRDLDQRSVDVLLNGMQVIKLENQIDANNRIETVRFADGTTLDISAFRTDVGTVGNDTIAGADHLLLRDDILFGLAGNDSLSGGYGNDLLLGGKGNDTYKYFGNGVDTIDESVEAGGTDTLLFGTGITSAGTTFQRMGSSLHDLGIYIGGKLSVIVKNQFDYTTDSTLETLKYSDNSTINLLTKSWTVNGTAAADTITGINIGAGGDILNGLGGDDMIMGFGGNDTLNGGTGLNYVYGGLGDDTYLYDGGSDRFYEEGGSDTVKIVSTALKQANIALQRVGNDLNVLFSGVVKFTLGGQFSDYNADASFEIIKFADNTTFNLLTASYALTATTESDYLFGISYGGNPNDTINALAGDDMIYSGAGNDTINGGLGLDTIDGGIGNDIFTVNYNEGHDNITDTGGTDRINLGVGFNSASMQYLKDGSDLRLVHSGSEVVRLGGYFDSADNIETVAFSNGTTKDLTAIVFTTNGTAADDYLYMNQGRVKDSVNGNAGNDVIYTFGGYDTAHGNDGSDSILGGTGNDILYGDNGNDYLYGEADNDTLYGGNNDDMLDGGEGNDILNGDAGIDYLYGGAGSDTLTSGTGADTLYGGTSKDTFVFTTATAFGGVDSIQDYSRTDGDMLKLTDLLIGYSTPSTIGSFVHITSDGYNSTLSVDRDGAGTAYSFQNIAILGATGSTNMNVLDLLNADHLHIGV